MRRILGLLAIGALSAPGLAAIRGTIATSLGAVELDSDQQGTVEENSDGSLRWFGQQTWSSIQMTLNWDFVVDGDPFITGVASFVNLQPVTTNISFDLSLASDSTIAAPTVFGASSLSVLDVNGNGAAQAALAGDSIYRAFILGNTQDTLYDAPYSLNAAPFNTNSAAQSWGPQPAIGGIVLGDLFGIDHDFSLTAGDQATVNSSFFIVPEPASLGLLLVGAMAIRRR